MAEQEAKQTADYSAEVKVKVPEIVEPVLKNPSLFADAIEKLYTLEKKTRSAADAFSTKTVAVAIVKLCFDLQKWDAINDNVALIYKRRRQLKQVMTSVVQEAMTYLDKAPEKETKMKLLKTLRTVTAGKIFVELESARLTKMLASIKEAEGDINGACDTLQEVQVEIVGSMEKREKAEFLLEQMRLCLAKKDFTRAEMVQNKVSKKVIAEKDFQDVKLAYYALMIQFYAHSSRYLDICKAYQQIFETPCVQESEAKWSEALKNAVMFLLLAPWDSEVNDLLFRIKEEKKIQELPSAKAALDLFTTDELTCWPLPFEAEWKQEAVFTKDETGKRWGDLRKSVVQHNIRVLSKYYNKIKASRMAQLLQLSEDETESHLSDMVSSKQLYAKIDRPSKIVYFAKPKNANDHLNEWSGDITNLLDLVNKACHLINKEYSKAG